MIGRSSNTCVKCGHAIPQGAGFCPNCGTQVHDIAFNVTSDETPETLLPGSTLVVPAGTWHRALIGEAVERRLDAIARALDRKATIRID